MANFFFNIRYGDNVIEDMEGQEFACVEEARHEAIEAARELLIEKIRGGQVVVDGSIEIADASGLLIASVLLIDQIHMRRECPSRRVSRAGDAR